MIKSIELTDSDKSKLIEMGYSIIRVTHISFDPDYGREMLYIQQKNHNKGEVIHWFEFCNRFLTEHLNHSWGEVEIDINPMCSAEPRSIVESFYGQFERKNIINFQQ